MLVLVHMPGIVAVVNDENEKPLLHSIMNSVKHKDWYLMDSYVTERAREIYDYSREKKNLEFKGHKF